MRKGGSWEKDNIPFREMATKARQAKWRRNFLSSAVCVFRGKMQVYDVGLAMDEKHPVERKFSVFNESGGRAGK